MLAVSPYPIFLYVAVSYIRVRVISVFRTRVRAT